MQARAFTDPPKQVAAAKAALLKKQRAAELEEVKSMASDVLSENPSGVEH